MELADVSRACEYALTLVSRDTDGLPWEGSEHQHIAYMLCTIPELMAAGRREKAMRWLGFVQGWLWARGLCSIEELKACNKPAAKANG